MRGTVKRRAEYRLCKNATQSLREQVRRPKGKALNILLDGRCGLSRSGSQRYVQLLLDGSTPIFGWGRYQSHDSMVPNSDLCVCVQRVPTRVWVPTCRESRIARKQTVETLEDHPVRCFLCSGYTTLLLLGYPTTTLLLNFSSSSSELGTQLVLTYLTGWVPNWYPSGVAA